MIIRKETIALYGSGICLECAIYTANFDKKAAKTWNISSSRTTLSSESNEEIQLVLKGSDNQFGSNTSYRL